MAEKTPKVELVPWDHASTAHVERMFLQRLDCGWRSDEVHEMWTVLVREGKKCLYWVVLRDAFADRESVISKHIAANPEETSPIHDTAQTHWQDPRTPTGRPFHPIGHIALDLRPEHNASLNLTDESIVWIASLYISHPLQARGLGRDAMRLAEGRALQPPLAARWTVLDTMAREQQLAGAFARPLVEGKPAAAVSNQDWYERQGYRVFFREKAGYTWVRPATGQRDDIDIVFLRKEL